MNTPDYNWCIQAISPSVLLPYTNGYSYPCITMCYNAYERISTFHETGRINKSFSNLYFSGLHKEGSDIKANYICDDWANNNGAGEYLCLESFGHLKDSCDLELETRACLQGGINYWELINNKLVFRPFPSEISQMISEYFMMVELTNEEYNFKKDCTIDINLLKEIFNDIYGNLIKGDLDKAGKIGDVYWAEKYKGYGKLSPFSKTYIDVRIYGAILGFPIYNLSKLGYGLLVPPSKRTQVIEYLLNKGHKVLPYGITPFGARICGKY